MIDRSVSKPGATVGADKGHDTAEFVAALQRLPNAPGALDVAREEVAGRPDSVSLASVIASSSLSKLNTGASGQNVCSCASTMSGRAPTRTVGSNELPPSA